MYALTDTPVGLKRILPFAGHQRADAVFLTMLSLLTLSGFIRHHKPTFGFHLDFLGTAITHYRLTHYRAGSPS